MQQRTEELHTTKVLGQYSHCHGLPSIYSEQRNVFSFPFLLTYACPRTFEYKRIIQNLTSTVVQELLLKQTEIKPTRASGS
jgi:hypothetical protein